MRLAIMMMVTLLAAPIPAWSADPHPGPAQRAEPAHAAETELPYPHPALPVDSATWAGVMLIIIAGMFLAAAAIGPIVRANAPEEVPDTHSHDQHGAGAHSAGHDSHGHGHGHH